MKCMQENICSKKSDLKLSYSTVGRASVHCSTESSNKYKNRIEQEVQKEFDVCQMPVKEFQGDAYLATFLQSGVCGVRGGHHCEDRRINRQFID